VLFPLVNEKMTAEKNSDALRDKLFDLRKRGFNRLYQRGKVFEFSTPESLLDVDFSKPVSILVDRIAITSDIRQRLVDSVEIGYRESGEVLFEPAEGGATLRFNEKFSCKLCGKTFVEPEPSLFSFNSPFGACKRCQGFGNTIDYDLDLVIPNRALSIQQGAVDPWTKPQYSGYGVDFRKDFKGKVRMSTPILELKKRAG